MLISVKDLAEKLDVRAKDIIARLLMRGVMATVNQTLDGELAIEMGYLTAPQITEICGTSPDSATCS